MNVRDWLFVEEHCSAIRTVLANGRVGETYNIGGNSERANIDVVKTICDLVDEMRPRAAGGSRRESGLPMSKTRAPAMTALCHPMLSKTRGASWDGSRRRSLRSGAAQDRPLVSRPFCLD